MRASAVIITFNEEQNIARCLKSLKGLVDEIVIVDSFSTDGTRAICESFGVKFVEHEFGGHIEQKNYAITQASNDIILSLDADECLDEHLYESIKHALANWTHDGYTMNRLTNYCGKWIRHGDWYPDVKLRLFDRRRGAWKGVNPHDEYMLNDKKAKTKHLKGDILHYSYYSIEEHYKQARYFSEIAAKAMLKNGKPITFVKRFLSPIARFLKSFIIKAGFLDGYYGFVIARIAAWETFRKYKLLHELRSTS